MNSLVQPASELLSAWKNFERTGVRRRDAAQRLGVSEAEIVAALARAGEATPLRAEWRGILERVPSLGRVMALTRNDACVIEKIGTYSAPEFANDTLGQVVGPDIDLRLFLQRWSYGYAVDGGDRASLEFFGSDGGAVHKIHAREETDRKAWSALVAAFGREVDRDAPPIAHAAREPELPDAAIDVDGYRAALSKMENTHEFFSVLRRFKLAREQALRLGSDAFAVNVPVESYRDVLYLAANRNVPIMAFVGNPGAIQIHTGAVRRIVEHAGFFNVLDATFNLHLLENGARSAWVVRKPTKSGIVSSLEVYDRFGDLVVQFFGERHNEPERPQWREVLAEIAN